MYIVETIDIIEDDGKISKNIEWSIYIMTLAFDNLTK